MMAGTHKQRLESPFPNRLLQINFNTYSDELAPIVHQGSVIYPKGLANFFRYGFYRVFILVFKR